MIEQDLGAETPRTLLFHDGELADVSSLLSVMGTPYVDRRRELNEEDRGTAWALVIASPQRMLDLGFGAHQKQTQQIAIVDRDSKTLRNSLRRHGIELMVRRPVHPAALRALVLHALYQGPEKRRNVRVSVGAPVSFRLGWRNRNAVLTDLSLGGFRLLANKPIEAGKTIRLAVSAEIANGKPFHVKGRVLRTQPIGDDQHHIMAAFMAIKPSQHEALRGTIRAHASGPAQLDAATAASCTLPSASNNEPPEETRCSETPEVAPQPETHCESADAERESQEAEILDALADEDRRDNSRHHMDRRVIALSDEATRVLMGRDISIGGMRVNPNPLLRVGKNVRLAIHVNGQEIPLVVTARVHRDDGERGVVLRFHQMEPPDAQILNQMLDNLPVLKADGDACETGLIVSEILPDL